MRALLIAVLAGVSLIGRAEVYPVRGGGDARIRSALYSPDEVYRVHGFVGFQIDFEFAPGETFVGLAAGDIEGLSFVAQDNHLFLKPRVASLGTNLTIMTTRRDYQLFYTVTAQRPDAHDPELLYALRFEYPPSPLNTASSQSAVEARLQSAAAGRAQNYDYWYCGASTLRPSAASDDGIHTRLRFGAHTELPAIFVRNDDGSESLLNFNVEEGDVIVHRIARRFILRRGALTGCIVNRSFSGSGDRLDSGTVAPDVERVRRALVP